MKIQVENLGPLRQACFELGDLTIICGNNNTGKTYTTYAFYGFLYYWERIYNIEIDNAIINELLSKGSTKIDLKKYSDPNEIQKLVNVACEDYSKSFPWVFGSAEKLFEKSKFSISLDVNIPLSFKNSYEQKIGSTEKEIFILSKKQSSTVLDVSLLIDRNDIENVLPSRLSVSQPISNALKEILFNKQFSQPFIASTERTGAAIFRKELDFARNRLLDRMKLEKNINPFKLLNEVYTSYALPVRENVDFARELETVYKNESFIEKNHHDIIDDFSDIIGGEYKVSNDKLYFIPKKTRIKLTMDQSSSAVRSLLDIGFYLRHVARPNDLLLVDEPELSLHPDNQRRIARLFARLLNLGIKIFITTHSDYIIRELNTLIMLNNDKPHIKKIRETYKYKNEELITSNKIKLYVAEIGKVKCESNTRSINSLTLKEATIDSELGIEVKSFDDTINEMNKIQDAIIFDTEEN